MQTLPELMDAMSPVKANQTQMMRMMKIEKSFKDIGSEVIDLVPEGRQRERILNILVMAKLLSVQEITHAKGLRDEAKNTADEASKPTQKKS